LDGPARFVLRSHKESGYARKEGAKRGMHEANEVRQPTEGENGDPIGETGACAPGGAREFHIVGIGASAGGLDSLERLFTHLPTDTGMAFVVLQHLSRRSCRRSPTSRLTASRRRTATPPPQDGVTIEAQTRDRRQRCYFMRILPYHARRKERTEPCSARDGPARGRPGRTASSSR